MEKEKRFVGMSAECAYVENKTIKTIALWLFKNFPELSYSLRNQKITIFKFSKILIRHNSSQTTPSDSYIGLKAH